LTEFEIKEKVRLALGKSRVDAGKTQQEMANYLGVKYQTVQNWEAGVSNPSFYKVYQWFDCLHLNMYAYMGTSKDTVDSIASLASNLSPECQYKLEQMLIDRRCERLIQYAFFTKEYFFNESTKA
jgi:transcriptional regulator with XRE-family HTH domain